MSDDSKLGVEAADLPSHPLDGPAFPASHEYLVLELKDGIPGQPRVKIP